MRAMFFAFLSMVMSAGQLWAFDLTKTPIFADGNWQCSKAKPKYDGEPPVQWGRFKDCTLRNNPTITGTVVYAFNYAEPLYKRWQRGKEDPYHAIHTARGWIAMGRANVNCQITADRDPPIAIHVHFLIWNSERTVNVGAFNQEYPWLQEVRSQFEGEEFQEGRHFVVEQEQEKESQ